MKRFRPSLTFLRNRLRLSLFLLGNFSGLFIWLASPGRPSFSAFAWIAFVPWLLALRNASATQRLGLGLLVGLYYSLPGKWGSIWGAANHRYDSFALALLLVALFFSCYLASFCLYSWLSSTIRSDSVADAFRQSALFTVIYSWMPTVFGVNPVHMLHDQPLMIQAADLGGLPLVLFILFLFNALIAQFFLLPQANTNPSLNYVESPTPPSPTFLQRVKRGRENSKSFFNCLPALQANSFWHGGGRDCWIGKPRAKPWAIERHVAPSVRHNQDQDHSHLLSLTRLFRRDWAKKPLLINGLLLAGLFAATAGYGTYRLREHRAWEQDPQAKWIRVLAVQTRISFYETLASVIRDNKKERFSALEWTRYGLKNHPEADLVVWPELPRLIESGHKQRLFDEKVQFLAADIQKPLLVNASESIEDATPERFYNQAQMVLPDGTWGPSYPKMILSPFYETNPLAGWVDLGEFSILPGETIRTLDLDPDRRIIPVICYEAHNPSHIRQFVALGGNVIVHMANFDTFGGGSIAYYDYAMSKFRAVECRAPMVRACNRGYGAFVKATGEVVEGSITDDKTRTVTCFPLLIPPARSWYAAVGDVFLYGLTLLLPLATLLRMVRPPKSRGNNSANYMQSASYQFLRRYGFGNRPKH